MRIESVRIENFRSIRDLKIECGPTTVLLGANNHGKSNVITALDYFFSAGTKPKLQDFFVHRDGNTISVEVTFMNLSVQEKKTFERYVDANGGVRICKTATLDPTTEKIETSYHGWLSQPDALWLRSDYSAPKKDDLEPALVSFLPATKKFSKAAVGEAQEAYIAANKSSLTFNYALEDGPLFGVKTVAAGILPDVYLLPAIRDLSQETGVKTTTLLGRLLNRAIAEMTTNDPEFGKLKIALDAVVQRLNKGDSEDNRPPQLQSLEKAILKELVDWNVGLDIEVAAPDVEKLFELGTSLHVHDGVRTPAEDKGHGFQRALIFALTRAWAESIREQSLASDGTAAVARAPSTSMILLIEEPELFLHPHAQRRLAASLRDLATESDHQVILCTHSPHFIDMEDYRRIAMLHKEDAVAGTCVRQCKTDLFPGEDNKSRKRRFHLAHWLNPDRSEMFFARRVAFVEGETETAVLPFLAAKMGVYDSSISIVDAGSKFNLSLYMELAGAFGFDHIVVHDEDPVDTSLVGDKLDSAKKTFLENAVISDLAKGTGAVVRMIANDFETMAGISKTQGNKKGKALAALDHFEDAVATAIPASIAGLVREIYAKARSPVADGTGN